ncbi:hypothetical protein [Promicromonospora sukumoe]
MGVLSSPAQADTMTTREPPSSPDGAHPTITSTIAEGSDVAVIGHVAASGRQYSNNVVVKLRDDRVVRVGEYIDTQHSACVLFPV